MIDCQESFVSKQIALITFDLQLGRAQLTALPLQGDKRRVVRAEIPQHGAGANVAGGVLAHSPSA